MSIYRRAAAALVVMAACVSLAACGSGAARPAAAADTAAASAGASPTGKVPVDGPSAASTPAPSTPAASGAVDAACRDAVKAEQALQASQAKDNGNRSALDKDFTTFANRLAADAQKESDSTAAQAMTSLSTDYTDLVGSQTGAAQLPNMATVQDDGVAFDQACAG